MKSLNFSHNWNNKLDCKYFTTLRLSDRFDIGDQVSVCLKRNEISKGEIINKKSIMLEQINDFIAGMDTGYSVDETKDILKKMYKDVDFTQQKIYLYLIKKIA
jgi:hypothetical protein